MVAQCQRCDYFRLGQERVHFAEAQRLGQTAPCLGRGHLRNRIVFDQTLVEEIPAEGA